MSIKSNIAAGLSHGDGLYKLRTSGLVFLYRHNWESERRNPYVGMRIMVAV